METPSTTPPPAAQVTDSTPPARRRVSPWPTSRLGWAKVAATVASIVLVAFAVVQYIGYSERQRCRDSIVSRHDIRASLHYTVATVIWTTQEDPQDLRYVVDSVDAVVSYLFGHPPCAARWGIDPVQVLRDREQMDPADPLVADALGVETPYRPDIPGVEIPGLPADPPGERPRGG